MTISASRLAANQRNAALSTGPRTAEGKLVSRNNALRHGLARPVTSDPAGAKEVEGLTRILAGSSNGFLDWELARELAESVCDIRRIRDSCSCILEGLGEFEKADIDGHERAAGQLARIWRYQQRALARHRKAMDAFSDAKA